MNGLPGAGDPQGLSSDAPAEDEPMAFDAEGTLIERRVLTPREADAFRAYMHDLNLQAAIAQGADPDRICSTCGEDVDDIHEGHEFTK